MDAREVFVVIALAFLRSISRRGGRLGGGGGLNDGSGISGGVRVLIILIIRILGLFALDDDQGGLDRGRLLDFWRHRNHFGILLDLGHPLQPENGRGDFLSTVLGAVLILEQIQLVDEGLDPVLVLVPVDSVTIDAIEQLLAVALVVLQGSDLLEKLGVHRSVLDSVRDSFGVSKRDGCSINGLISSNGSREDAFREDIRDRA